MLSIILCTMCLPDACAEPGLVDNFGGMSTNAQKSPRPVDKAVDNATVCKISTNRPLSTVYLLFYKREEKIKRRNPLYTRARVDIVDTLEVLP